MAVAEGAVQLSDAVAAPVALAVTPVAEPGAKGIRIVLLVAAEPLPLTLTAFTVQL